MAVVDPFSPSSSTTTTTDEIETEPNDKINDSTETSKVDTTTCDVYLPDKSESTASLTGVIFKCQIGA